MPTLPNMTLVIPTENGDADVWDTILNSQTFPRIDAHDHTTGNGVRIPSAALKINADVMWASGGINYAITDAKAFDFTPVASSAVATYASALFVDSADNNLYFRNQLGTNVKITDGNTINVSIVGGIGGDYAAIGALFDYDDANDTYRARQETAASVRQYAKIASADLILREYKAAGDPTVPVNAVTLKSPAALAASYAVTMPAALPAAASIVQLDAAGVMTASNTIPTPTAPDYKFSTAQSVSINAMEAVEQTPGTHTRSPSSITGVQKGWLLAASTNKIAYPLRLPVGSRITGYSVFVEKNTDNTNTLTARLYSTRTSTLGTESALGSGVANNANSPGFMLLSESGLAIDILAGFEYYLVFTPGGGINPSADILYDVEVSFTRP